MHASRTAMTNLDSILKSRDITLLTKVCLVKAIVFPVVGYGCKSWNIKKDECQRIDVFELWCWRRLESPLDCKEIKPDNHKGNQSWIFIGRTNTKAEAPPLTTWCEDLTHWKRPWCWERLKAGGEGDDRGWYGWMASLTRWTWVWASSGCWLWTGMQSLTCCQEGLQRVRHDWVTEKNWTECRRHGFNPLVGKIPWRRAWQPIPVFLPGESHGQGSLVGYCLRIAELDTTEVT